MIFEVTPSQTVGPYFAIGLPYDGQENAVAPETPGAIKITGTLYDGDGVPVPDHVIEIWQADGDGNYADMLGYTDTPADSGFRGFARHAEEDGEGGFEFVTVKPGKVPGPGKSTQAPHIAVTVMARGMLDRVVTRIYFADEAEANAKDPILASVPADRRETLIAEPTADGGYRFDIRLQGDGETVFFSI